MCDVMMSHVLMSCVMMSQDGGSIGQFQNKANYIVFICVRNLLINEIQWISCAILHVVLLINIFCNKTIKSV